MLKLRLISLEQMVEILENMPLEQCSHNDKNANIYHLHYNSKEALILNTCISTYFIEVVA